MGPCYNSLHWSLLYMVKVGVVFDNSVNGFVENSERTHTWCLHAWVGENSDLIQPTFHDTDHSAQMPSTH